jgi:Zn-dependent protease with chaperone function
MARPAAGPELFSGPQSLRVRGEIRTLVFTLIGLSLVIAGAKFLSYFVTTVFSWREVAIVVVVGMVYVTLGRGRLLGGSIRVHEGQFGSIHAIVAECAARLKMNVPQVFVRDDPFVPLVAVGIGEPYAIVISAQWVDHLAPDEIRFLVGRELAHITAGHTRITSLLSVNGRENALIAIVFGAWLRRIEYTADRIGLLCCRSLDAAFSAISVSAFHSVGRKIDMNAFAEQQRELEAEPSLRMGEWISSTPYATNRIFALRAFARDARYLEWTRRLDAGELGPAPSLIDPTSRRPSRKMYAGAMRRAYAWFIDFMLVASLLPPVAEGKKAFHAITIDKGDDIPPWIVTWLKFIDHAFSFNGQSLGGLAMLAYCIILVAIAGQTCGMMILDMRVVTSKNTRPGLGGAIMRYLMQGISYSFIPIGWFRFWGRVQPYEKWSRTRIVEGAQLAARVSTVSAPQLEPAAP